MTEVVPCRAGLCFDYFIYLRADSNISDRRSYHATASFTRNVVVSVRDELDKFEVQVGSQVYEIIEAQTGPAGNDFGSWRLFLINKTAVPFRSSVLRSLAEPNLSATPPFIPEVAEWCSCSGVHLFIFGANNGTTPPGGHMFVYPLE